MTTTFSFFFKVSKVFETIIVSLSVGDQNNKHTADSKISAVQEKRLPPLPFLGRSQSLLNIPLSLDISSSTKMMVASLVDSPLQPQLAAVNQSSSGVTKQQPTAPRRPLISNNSSKRIITGHQHKPDIIKYQSLPHKESQSKKSSQHQQCRNKGYSTVPHRSKSVDAKSALQQQQQHNYNYNVSQVELFATIQRHSRGQVANSKNMTVTSSAMVGVRHDANGSSNNHNKPSEIVVQAMVHQDAEIAGRYNPSSSTVQRPKSFDPIYEPLVVPCYRKTNDVPSSAEAASIELTADQVRELIRAISAANNGPSGWPLMTGHQPPSSQITSGINNPIEQLPAERDMNVANANAARLPPSSGRGLERSDSFEGHEEAVSLLVDAVREIQSICNSKKGCEHLWINFFFCALSVVSLVPLEKS